MGTNLSPTNLFYPESSPQAISLVVLRSLLITPSHMATLMAVQKGSFYRWGTKLSPTNLFYLYSSPQAISLVVLRSQLITPSHLATLMVVQ